MLGNIRHLGKVISNSAKASHDRLMLAEFESHKAVAKGHTQYPSVQTRSKLDASLNPR